MDKDVEPVSPARVGVRPATVGDIPRAAVALARAFADGPVTRWHVPDDARRLDTMARFFDAALRDVFLPHGEVYATDGAVEGCSMWMPPRAGSIRDEGTASFDIACERIFHDFPRTFELFEIMAGLHPNDAGYHLAFVGVDPMAQRRGMGAALVAPVLAVCDRDRITASLDADDRSRPFHERMGFEVTREIRLPDGPTLWAMERRPMVS